MHVKFDLPGFTEQDALRFARDHFGLNASVRPLPGERDQNFYLKSRTGEEYVLKIANLSDNFEILDLQNKTLAHLAEHAPGLSIQRVIAASSGQIITAIPDGSGGSHFLRLLTYVPGDLWVKVNPHPPELLRSLGGVLGMMDRALLDFSHPAASRRLKWDLARASWIRDYLQYITDASGRALVERLLAHYESHVVPSFPNLRASVIYNDANDYNILVSNDDARNRRVIGVIDFGDMLHSFTVCDLAIGCTYAILGKPDPLIAATHVVAGYHQALPLTEPELEVLFPLILTRLAVSVTNSAYQRHADPDNEYLLISQGPAWDLLNRLADVPLQFGHYAFRQACGLSACPATSAIVEWLTANPHQIGQMVEPGLNEVKSVVFDLSVESTQLGNTSEFEEAASLARKLQNRMEAEGAAVGVGRHDEARALYTTDGFRIEGNSGPEWRTVHLGLDIFLQPGTPIFAPLDGRVECVNDTTLVLRHGIEDGPTFFTLYRHLASDSLADWAAGMAVLRGTCVGSIGPDSGLPSHLHFQIVADLLGYRTEFPALVRPSERDVWLGLSPDPNLIAGIPTHRLAWGEMKAGAILDVRRQRLGRNLSIAYDRPVHIVRGYRQYLYDADGRRYLDAVNNVPHVGHCHPRVVKAGQAQMAVLNTNSRYLHENIVCYAERLSALLPEPLRVVYFVCSGSEANELALRLARTYTGSKETIVVDLAYHGNTNALIEVSPYKYEGPGGAGPQPFIHKVPIPDTYRGVYKADDPQAGEKYARPVAEAVARIKGGGHRPAFLCESLMGSAGQIPLAPGYLVEAYRHVRAAGGVCIADEVQVGLGRVGSRFWGFALQEVVPDIVTLGKPMGNGHPLGAVVTTPEIADAFNNGMEYFNTFGGNPVSCAIGMAVLDVIEEEGLQAHALEVGDHLMAGLRQLQDRHGLVGDVRGSGLFVGVELVKNRETLERALDEASYIVNRMKEHGLLVSADFNSLKIKPPLVFTKADADFLVETLDKVLQEDFVRYDER